MGTSPYIYFYLYVGDAAVGSHCAIKNWLQKWEALACLADESYQQASGLRLHFLHERAERVLKNEPSQQSPTVATNALHLMDYSLNVLSLHLQWRESDWTLQETEGSDQRTSHCKVSWRKQIEYMCCLCFSVPRVWISSSSLTSCLHCGGCSYMRQLSACQTVIN